MTHNTRKPRLRSSVSLAAAVLLGTAGLAAPAVAAPDPSTTPDSVTETLTEELAESDVTTTPDETDAAGADAGEPADESSEVLETTATEVEEQQVADATDLTVAAISDFHGAIKTAPFIAGILDGLRAVNDNVHFVSVGATRDRLNS